MMNKFFKLRQFFPILRDGICYSNSTKNCDQPNIKINFNKVLLDNAATSQKPQQVIDRMAYYYSCENAAVHRSIYSSAEHATNLYEQARKQVAAFINAYSDEIIFTKGTTESINFVASTWGVKNLSAGDEIIISELEHNANVLPWLHLSKTRGIILKYIPVDESGNLDYKAYQNLLSNKTKLVAITHRANSIGTKVDLDVIISAAKRYNAAILVDAAQTIGHEKIDVATLQPDFLVFSSHKILGPTGIGVLYINRSIQEITPPYQFGGGMVLQFDSSSISFVKGPQKYEAGTQAIAESIGLAEAIKFIDQHIDFNELKVHQREMSSKLLDGLKEMKSIKILGDINQLVESPIISFHSERFHPHDIAAYLDQFNISVRAGNQCAQLIYHKLGISGSLRISTYFYNTIEEIDFLLSKLEDLF